MTAQLVAHACEQYRDIVNDVYNEYPVDPDIVLAMMAQESGCNRWATDGVSVGLMQVTAKSWTPSEQELYNPRTSIEWGMYLLYSALTHPRENPDGDLHRGLSAYNCGWVSLNAGKCLWFGGPAYADRVLDFWLPYFK